MYHICIDTKYMICDTGGRDMIQCDEWEAVPDPMGLGRGWTAVRQCEDERGPFEEWCGEFFPSADAARQAVAEGRLSAAD